MTAHRIPDEARRAVLLARRAVVLTGAGMSAESGVPTFRGAEGLWRRYAPQDLATPDAFAGDPRLVWEWYEWRRALVAAAAPNAGHRALARWEARGVPVTVVTQNVDGLHRAAGSGRVIELHGSLWRVRCTDCGREEDERRVPLPEVPPRCGVCQAFLRPAVVWFGEPLDVPTLTAASGAVDACDLLLVVGTSGLVEPAASLAVRACNRGAFTLEVNVERSALSTLLNVTLLGPAGEVLPRLLDSEAAPCG